MGDRNVDESIVELIRQEIGYKLREVIQDALKFSRHAKRPVLSTSSVSQALRLRGEEPVYGAWGQKRAEFIRASGVSDVLVSKDPFVSVQSVVARGLPPPPVEVSFVAHWLAVAGVQPVIAENMPLDHVASKKGGQKRGRGAAGSDHKGRSLGTEVERQRERERERETQRERERDRERERQRQRERHTHTEKERKRDKRE